MAQYLSANGHDEGEKKARQEKKAVLRAQRCGK